MKMIFCFTLAAFFVSNQIRSQNFEVPANYELNTKEDYVRYEKDIIACANWLEYSPLDKEEKKRMEANAFLMKWLTGPCGFTVNLNADLLVIYCDKNAQLQMIFLAAWARYALQNNYSNDQPMGYYEGYKAIVNVYSRDVAIKKDKDTEKLVEMYNKGELQNWIKDKLN